MGEIVEQVIERFKNGQFVIVIDEEGGQCRGDLIIAAQHTGPEQVNFMMQHARGLICVALTGERLEELNLPPMVPDSQGSRAAFMVSVDAREGITNGDSAVDRARTIATLIDPDTNPRDLLRPGHVFPLRAVDGGVLRRVGHTEAAVDLARLAGLYPAGVLCQILDDQGLPATMETLQQLAAEYGISIIKIAELIAYRRKHEKLVERRAEAHLPTIYGDFNVIVYTSLLDGTDYLVVYKGDPTAVEAPLVRVHSGCITGDVLGSLKCDCGWQIAAALQRIEAEGCGVVVYVASHEGRGIGLAGIGAQVLADMGITKMRLMTNNPAKYAAMEGYGLEVVERVPLEAPANEHCLPYLRTKRDKMGHLLTNI